MQEICRFQFDPKVDCDLVDEQMRLAVIVVEILLGRATVRLNAACCVSEEKPQAIIDVSTVVGRHIAKIFTGLISRSIGDDKFSIDRIKRKLQEGVLMSGRMNKSKKKKPANTDFIVIKCLRCSQESTIKLAREPVAKCKHCGAYAVRLLKKNDESG